MESEIYVLGLLKFKDGKVVFNKEELGFMHRTIRNSLQDLVLPRRKPKKRGGWHVYSLDPQIAHIKKSREFKVKSAELGYYHHRVIVYFRLNLKDGFLALREARKKLARSANNIIEKFVKDKINELVSSGKIKGEGEVKFIYTYPLIIAKKRARNHEPLPFSEETTSLCFEVVEPKWWPPSGKKHMMRISIPSTILYAQKKVRRNLLRDIINAIYQYCLYEKKAKDEKKLEEKKKELKEKKLESWENASDEKVFENRLDEDLLVNLWEHILDTMGGRSADIRVVRITNTTRLIALLALLASCFTLIITVLSRLGI